MANTYNPMLGYNPIYTMGAPSGTTPGAPSPQPAGQPVGVLPGLPYGSGVQTPATPPISPPNTPAPAAPAGPDPVYQAMVDRHGGGRDERGQMSGAGTGGGRTVGNNFGISPDWARTLAGAVSMAPGPLGLAGTVANAGLGLNNVAGVDAARKMLGMPGLSTAQALGTVAGMNDYGNQGFIGDTRIGAKNYGVSTGGYVNNGGFAGTGLGATGRTTLTPMEAVNRQILGKAPAVTAGANGVGRDRSRDGGPQTAGGRDRASPGERAAARGEFGAKHGF